MQDFCWLRAFRFLVPAASSAARGPRQEPLVGDDSIGGITDEAIAGTCAPAANTRDDTCAALPPRETRAGNVEFSATFPVSTQKMCKFFPIMNNKETSRRFKFILFLHNRRGVAKTYKS